MNDQAEALRKLVKQHSAQYNEEKTKFISVTSGKGGVGKSNFSLNFSIALQRFGKRYSLSMLILEWPISMCSWVQALDIICITL